MYTSGSGAASSTIKSNVIRNKNPFKMPTDEQVFALRNEERRQKEIERNEFQKLKVFEKMTASQRVGSAAARGGGLEGADVMGETRSEPARRERELGTTVEVREPDSMSAYILSKREMGLKRMSLAAQKEEIRKLEEEAEQATRRVKQQLDRIDETEQKFGLFVQDSHDRSTKATNTAEELAREKQKKVADNKKLTTTIAQLETDKKKNEEQLKLFERYKKFLDDLTDPAWFPEALFTLTKQQHVLQIENDYAAKANEASVDGLDISPAELEQQKTLEIQQAVAALEKRKATWTSQYAKARLDEELNSGASIPMFFTDPEKLLSKFQDLEESNLQLIQGCQQYEEQNEEVLRDFKREHQAIEEQMRQRAERRKEFLIKKESEERKLADIIERLRKFDEKNEAQLLIKVKGDKDDTEEGEDVDPNDVSPDGKKKAAKYKSKPEVFNNKITEVYNVLHLGSAGRQKLAIDKLEEIETRLEEIRNKLDRKRVPFEAISLKMKNNNRLRRTDAMKEQLRVTKLERDKKNIILQRRSERPVIKRVSKPVMWRTQPYDAKRKNVTSTGPEDNTEENEMDFFVPPKKAEQAAGQSVKVPNNGAQSASNGRTQ